MSDATHQAALDHFGVQGLVELVATLGYFAMIALPLNAFEIEMSADQMNHAQAVRAAPYRWGSRRPARNPASATCRRSQAGRRASRALRRSCGMRISHPSISISSTASCAREGWISGVFQVLLHSPDMAERMAYVGEFFLDRTILPPDVRALTGLIVARELDSDYLWNASPSIAGGANIDPKLI